jgi:hypothetical protein
MQFNSLLPQASPCQRLLKILNDHWKMLINTHNRSEVGSCFVFNYYSSPVDVLDAVTPNLERNI